jgi:CBS domain-containing protein
MMSRLSVQPSRVNGPPTHSPGMHPDDPPAVDTVEAPSARLIGGRLLTRLFHRVNSVIPEDQEVATVGPQMTVAEALVLLQRNRFSQVAVVRGAEVLGSFSYRSFTRAAIRLQQQQHRLEELPVEEFMEDLDTVHATSELASIFDALDRDDAVLIGAPDNLQAIVTPMDVMRYLYRLAEPYVQLGEIERSLRMVVVASVDSQELSECAHRALAPAYQAREADLPTQAEAMTLGELVSIVRDSRNWPHFEPLLGSRRELVAARLSPLPELRNDVFHFRRELTDEDREKITVARNWLLGKLRGTPLAEGTHG